MYGGCSKVKRPQALSTAGIKLLGAAKAVVFNASCVRVIPALLFLCCTGAAAAEPEGGYGLGRPVSSTEIAAWDIDVSADGRGLPRGQGNVPSGEKLYAQKCAVCHGATGIEGPYNVLVGRLPGDAFSFARKPGTTKTIGNYWPYATTVFDYINRAMPFDAPGSLSADEVYALVAYLLYRNDIVPRNISLSQSNLAEIQMPSRDRFVPDNRKGGPELR